MQRLRVGVEGSDMSYPRAASWLSVLFAGGKSSGKWSADAAVDKDVSLESIFRCKSQMCAELFETRVRSSKAKQRKAGGSECLGVCFESRVVGLSWFELFQHSDPGST